VDEDSGNDWIGSTWLVVRGGSYDPDGSDREDVEWSSSVAVAVSTYEPDLEEVVYVFTEFELGYMDGGRRSGGGDEIDTWAVPLMMNFALAIPIDTVHVYGGMGLGMLFFELPEGSGDPLETDDENWVARSVFLGLRVHLGDRFFIGVEGEYFDTRKVGELEGKPFNGYTISATLGVRLWAAPPL